VTGEILIQLQAAHDSSITSVEYLKLPTSSTNSLPSNLVHFATASWDKSIKIWCYDKARAVLQCVQTLKGHQMNVLCLLSLMPRHPMLVSGCGDGSMKLWVCDNPNMSDTIGAFRELKTVMGSTTCVRGFAELPGIGFLSVSNDGLMKTWTLQGENIQEINAHNNLTYSVTVSSRSESGGGGSLIYTASEDKTVKVWKNGELMQTIEHPACVWKVVELDNGDIATACADCTARVFTREQSRIADAQVIQNFNKNIQSSKVKKSGVDTATLQSPAALQKPGSKSGEVKMVNNNGMPEAWSWNADEGRWEKMGDIVEGPGVGSGFSDRVFYEGNMYDYVFDIELEQAGSGTRTYKLPYNRAMNPYEAAQDFIWKHEMPQYYLDQIAKFVMKNSDSADANQMGTGAAKQEESEWEKEQKKLQQLEQERSTQRAITHFPAKLVSFDQANTDGIVRKVKEFNDALKNGGSNVAMNDAELDLFNSLITAIKTSNFSGVTDAHFSLLDDKLLKWPLQQLFPIMDLMRLVILTPVGSRHYAQQLQTNNRDILSDLLTVMKQAASNNVLNMLFMRFAANIFIHNADIAARHYNDLVMVAKSFSKSQDKNIQTSSTTLVLNLAAQKRSAQESEELLLSAISEMLTVIVDHSLIYRLLVAAGTLLKHSPALVQRASTYNLPQLVQQFTTSPTPQVHGVAFQLKQLF